MFKTETVEVYILMQSFGDMSDCLKQCLHNSIIEKEILLLILGSIKMSVVSSFELKLLILANISY